MNLSVLAQQNPWWKDKKEIEKDPKIVEFSTSKIKWIPKIKDEFSYTGSIYTLRGPRQVGKTTLMKLIIRDFLEKNPPESVFYFTCDLIRDEKELSELIEEFLRFSDGMERRLIILDEISSVENWERAIKYEKDIGKLEGVTLILTGSHSLDMRYSSERLPGRRGEIKERVNKIMFPMSFFEYVKAIKPEIIHRIEKFKGISLNSLLKPDEASQKVMDILSLYSEEIYSLFEKYLLTGGMIKPTNLYFSDGSIDSMVYEIYIRSIIGDMARWRYREDIVRQILKGVIDRMSTVITYNSIAKSSEISSHNTVSKYLEALEHSFVLLIMEQMDIHRNYPNPKKGKKVYIKDPFIYHSINGWVHGRTDYFEMSKELLFNPEAVGKVAEMVVASHLERFLYNRMRSDIFSVRNHLFFWRKGEREVDFILKIGEEIIPIEVKYRKKVRGYIPFSRRIILSKNTLDLNEGKPVIPVPYFLMLEGLISK